MYHVRHPLSLLAVPVFAAALLLAALLPAGLAAQSVDPLVVPPGAASQTAPSPPPLRIAERFGVEPLAVLSEASVGARDELEALLAWNKAGLLPVQNGFSRPLPLPRNVRLVGTSLRSRIGGFSGGVLGQSGPSTFVWGAQVRVERAHRLRLHLADIKLPATARLWVYGEDGEARGPFGLKLVHQGRLLTPSVAGPVIHLEVEMKEDALQNLEHAGFTIDQVTEIFALGPDTTLASKGIDPSCLVDATCVGNGTFPAIEAARRAVGQMSFVKAGGSFVCTGALLNDTIDGTFIPYFLTANHCFATQASASTLEVTWDGKTNSCNGAIPESFPTSNGSTLLATSSQSDFTLVRLTEIPEGRALLGWDARASSVPVGTVFHRVSHPAPFGVPQIQSYSRSVRSSASQSCYNPQRFLVATMQQGGTYGGSSGGPLMLASGHVVGQLSGGCGPDAEDGCNYENFEGDGWFGHTFGFISDFLAPDEGGGGDGPCVPGELTACVVDGRFEITTTSPRSLFDALAGRVAPVIQGDLAAAFHFFLSEENFHVVIKIAKRPSGFYAVSIAGLDLFPMTIRIRDSETGEVKTYVKPDGELSLPVDAQAFPVNP